MFAVPPVSGKPPYGNAAYPVLKTCPFRRIDFIRFQQDSFAGLKTNANKFKHGFRQGAIAEITENIAEIPNRGYTIIYG
jgi:hypothetical protein